MGVGIAKRIEETEYKHVRKYRCNAGGKEFYRAEKSIKGKNWSFSHSTAKGAALALDIKLVQLGFTPINILVKK